MDNLARMFRKSFWLVLLPFLLGNAYAAIDLTPSVTEIVEEGITYREVTFKTPEGKVLLNLSPGWSIRGQKESVQISAADKSAEAVIARVPLLKLEPLDEAAITAFKKEVLAALPPGSAKVTVVSEAQNSFMPGGNPSFEVVVSYDLWGKAFQRSALLVNGPQDRLMFRFTAFKQDFAPLNTQFRRMAMSWRAVENKPSPPLVADGAAPAPAAN